VLAGDRVRGELVRRNRQLAQAKSELERAARTDPLTGLLNRRGLAEIVAEQSTNPYSGSIAVLDLNSFKKLNDQYGHQAGDVALLLVARALRQNLRVTDPIVRTGGDEFVILMPNGELPELEERLERVKLALHDQRLPGVPNPLTLQAAWGTATFQNADEVWPAISQADAAMYRAKATHHQRHPASVEVVAPQGNFSA
jgi:diguanylate cyclase (GGDEF)-like protein